MTIIELRNKRAQKLAAAKAFLESNRNADGFLSEEDDAVYTGMENDITNLGKEISRIPPPGGSSWTVPRIFAPQAGG